MKFRLGMIGSMGPALRALVAGAALCGTAVLAAESPSKQDAGTGEAPPPVSVPTPPASANPEAAPSEGSRFDETIQRLIDAARQEEKQLPGFGNQTPPPSPQGNQGNPSMNNPSMGTMPTGSPTSVPNGPNSPMGPNGATDRDPTKASPRMQEILGARTATATGQSSKRQVPRIELKGRVIGLRSASVALLSVDGGPTIQVREGASFSYLNMTLRVAKLDVQEVQIVVEPLEETIVLR